MNLLFQGIVFCIVLFLYIHVYHHLKTSSDLELYELNLPTKQHLEEVCDIRQPVKIQYNDIPKVDNEQFLNEFLPSLELPTVEDAYGVFDIYIRNNQPTLKNSTSPFHKTQDVPTEQEAQLPFLLTKAIPLFQKDQHKKYYSEGNLSFLEETGMIKKYKHYDGFLRPYMVSTCEYDYMIGSNQTTTPLRYGVNYRTYYVVTYGQVTVTMIPPSYTKYLHASANYELFEFSSPVNPWNPQKHYRHDFEKTKTLTLTLQKGDILYIPAYWWYSIRFDQLSSLSVLSYRTYMNTLAILPHLTQYGLQHMNVKHQVAKIEQHAQVLTGKKIVSHATESQAPQEPSLPPQHTESPVVDSATEPAPSFAPSAPEGKVSQASYALNTLPNS